MSYAVIVPAARLRYAKRPPNTRGINLNDNIHYLRLWLHYSPFFPTITTTRRRVDLNALCPRGATTMDELKLRENEVHAEEEDGDLLADYFEKSASAVRDSFGRCVSGVIPAYMRLGSCARRSGRRGVVTVWRQC